LVIRIELLAYFRFGIRLEVFIDALVVLVGTTAICDTPIVTGC